MKNINNNPPGVIRATTTQPRLILGAGRVPTLSGLLNNNPIIAVAATVVGSLLRLFSPSRPSGDNARIASPQRERVQAKLDSYSTSRRLRSSYTRTASRKRANACTCQGVKVNLNPEGRRHG